ncbi:MAG: FAD-dependent oxidoreductase [Anaerolineales bacterium]|nr:FAD-dependent oxidoreductase [Anaerolineales bacterium]
MTKVAILGAGIAGLSSGWLLQKQGIDFVILEKQSYIGGLARSFEWGGFFCDFAAHRLFTSDEEVLQQLLNLTPMARHIRRSRIFMNGRWMRDPLDVIELGVNLPIFKRLGLLWSYAFRHRDLPDDCFENYVLRRYGRSLYQLFFKPYTEKLFGIAGSQISVLWARQKVRLANPLDTFREDTKTKFQYFYYPLRKGYGAIVNCLYEKIKENVQLEAKVLGFERRDGKITNVIYEQGGKQHVMPAEFVISTLPLSITGQLLDHSFPLQYQKVDAVYLLVNRPLVSDYHWVYFIDDDVCVNRMVEFKNMSAVDTPADTSVICAEVTQYHDDVVEKVISDLIKVGMITREDILDTKVIREKFAYPVYDRDYDKVIQNAQDTLGQYSNLHLVGRAAEFRHREVDDNFAAATETIKKIVAELSPQVIAPDKETTVAERERKKSVYAVLLTQNHYEDTRECLVSLLKSDHPETRIIVVDNGSNDGTPGKIRESFSDVHVIENGQNIGIPAGYNVGFKYALQQGADYVLMLNYDTVVSPQMVTELLSVAESDPKAGMIMPKVYYYGSERIWSSGGHYRSFPPSILLTDRRKGVEDSTRTIEYAPNCGLLIHRRAFEKVGFFDPGYIFYYDDWDFSERLRAYGLNIWYASLAHMWNKATRSTQGPRTPEFWYTYGASIVRFYRRHGRPIWLSLPVHVGYVILREFVWKRNWAYWLEFQRGMSEGLQKPLGSFPLYKPDGN